MDEFEERDVAVVVAVKDSYNTPDEGVVGQLGDLEELGGLEGATLIPVNLAEVLVELLELLLIEVQVLELLLLLLEFVAHTTTFL